MGVYGTGCRVVLGFVFEPGGSSVSVVLIGGRGGVVGFV